jgi:hypothetical protein
MCCCVPRLKQSLPEDADTLERQVRQGELAQERAGVRVLRRWVIFLSPARLFQRTSPEYVQQKLNEPDVAADASVEVDLEQLKQDAPFFAFELVNIAQRHIPILEYAFFYWLIQHRNDASMARIFLYCLKQSLHDCLLSFQKLNEMPFAITEEARHLQSLIVIDRSFNDISNIRIAKL